MVALSDYKVFRLADTNKEGDWVRDLELDGAHAFQPQGQTNSNPPKILVLYGSLRQRSYSQLLAYEFARILDLLGKCNNETRLHTGTAEIGS